MRRVAACLFATTVALLLAHVASAQLTCPKAEEGHACDGGYCVAADCMFEAADGGTADGGCDLCLSFGPTDCLTPNSGPACPAGETCHGNVLGESAEGEGIYEAGDIVSWEFDHLGQCEGPDAGDDSGNQGGDGGDTESGTVTKDAGAPRETSASSGGCGIASTTRASSMLPLAAVLGLALVRRRRAKR